MRPEVISIAVLLAMFVAGTVWPVNLGVLGFAAAYLVGTSLFSQAPTDIIGVFPADLFLLLVGVTYLFGIAQANGTIDLLVNWAVRLVGARTAALPWVFFAVAALLSSIGALFAVAIVAPVAMRFASRARLQPLMVGMMVVHGSLAGAFSPISVYGSFVNRLMAASALPSSPVTLFLSPLVLNLAIAAAAFLTLGGASLVGRRLDPSLDEQARRLAASTPSAAPARSVGIAHVATLAGILVLAVGTVAFGWHVGLVSMTIAAVLALLSPGTQADAVQRISWSTVLLVSGMLTYVGVLDRAGTIDYVSGLVTTLAVPLVAALLLCVIGGVTSAFASSVAILGVLVPLAVPFLKGGEIGPIGMVAALAVATTVVDVSPFSTNGALVLANADVTDRDGFYRQMLAYSAVVVALGPAVAWAVLVLPGWLG